MLLNESEITQLSLSQPVPLTLHPAAVYLSSLAPGSRRTMRSSLNAIGRSLPLRDRFVADWRILRCYDFGLV